MSRHALAAARIRVKLRASTRRPLRRARVRLSGTVCPAHRGALVRIQRLAGRRLWRTVARARARAGSGSRCSTYRTSLRVMNGMTLRAIVSADRRHAQGVSGSVRLRLRIPLRA